MASRRCGQERRDPISSDREGVAWHGPGVGTSYLRAGHARTHARTLARSVHFAAYMFSHAWLHCVCVLANTQD
jgi:hypothetical protein